MLTAYGRHTADCPHKNKGQGFSLCTCPIWTYGYLNEERVRMSVRTKDAAVAEKSSDVIAKC